MINNIDYSKPIDLSLNDGFCINHNFDGAKLVGTVICRIYHRTQNDECLLVEEMYQHYNNKSEEGLLQKVRVGAKTYSYIASSGII